MRVHLSTIYYAVLLLASIFVATRFRKLDKATKVICIIIWLGGLTEVTGRLEILYDHTNYKAYNTSFFLEFLLICLYFHYSVPSLRKYNTCFYIAGIGIIFGTLNTLFVQPFKTALNSNFLFFECLSVVWFSMYAIYRILRLDSNRLRLQRKTHFWIPCILLFYQSITLWSWGMYDHLGENAAEKAKVYDIMVLVTNITTYLSYSLLIFLYPKMKRLKNDQ